MKRALLIIGVGLFIGGLWALATNTDPFAPLKDTDEYDAEKL